MSNNTCEFITRNVFTMECFSKVLEKSELRKISQDRGLRFQTRREKLENYAIQSE